MADSGFWETMNVLVGREFRRTGKEVMDDVQDWVEKVIVKKDLTVDKEDDEIIDMRKRKLSDTSGYGSEVMESEIKKFLKKIKLPKVECNFCHPQVRSRLEKLMGSNYVSLTDREYMQRLQHRILEDYAESMDKRIKVREAEEMERVKTLVLNGKIPLDQAPPEMADHPIMLIENYCNQLIAERRAKIKIPKVKVPTYLYWDDTPDPPSGLSIEKGHVFGKDQRKLCQPVERYLGTSEEDDITNGYMLTPEDYELYRYESPIIKQLRACETVEEMYDLADEIIGIMKETIEELPKTDSESIGG